MLAAGLEEVEMYVTQHQNNTAQYIKTHTILELCLDAERRTVYQVEHIWCEKGGPYLEDMREAEV